MLHRIARAFLIVVENLARVAYQIILWFFLVVLLSLAILYGLVLADAVILSVIVFGMAAPCLLKRGIFLERFVVRDPLLIKLNSHQDDSNVLVFWFLVPVDSSTPSANFFWEGRLIAMSRLVADRLKKSEENQERDTARIEGRISSLEATLLMQTQNSQELQDRLIRIEQMLEQMMHPAPQIEGQ